jgi:hypothetical protein
LETKFPEVAETPEKTIRLWFHFNHWVDAMAKGLENAFHMTSIHKPPASIRFVP